VNPRLDSSENSSAAWRFYEAERQRYLPRNYWANVVEGGLYMAGAAFVAGETVLPAMVKSLGGPNWLIAMTPILVIFGFSLPPLIMAHLVERLTWMKPYVMIVTIFQRIPYLIAGLALVIWGPSHPEVALPFVILAPLLSGLGAGLAIPAWFEMVCRVIPQERMASSWALRFLIQGIGGLLAGGVIAFVLDRYPGPRGFGILMLITFAFLVLSFFVLALMKEVRPPVRDDPGSHETLIESWRSRWRIWKENLLMRRFLYARMLAFAYLLPAPYLGLQALADTGKPESFLGTLVIVQMIGGISANAGSALMGDRLGARWLLLASRMTLMIVCIGLWLADGVVGWIGIFFFYGFSFATQNVGFSSMLAQLCPPGKRPTFMALQSLVSLPCLLGAALVAGIIMDHLGGMMTIATVTFVFQASAGYFLLQMPKGK